MNDFGLDEKTILKLKDFFKNFSEIQSVKIYGSRALGTYRKGSDIDFVIFGDITPDLIKKITYKIEDINIPYMFDITEYSSIQNEKLKEHIDKFAKDFYSKV